MKVMKIIFATHNQHKLDEVRDIIARELPADSGIEVCGLHDIGCDEDIPETGNTLMENALQKAQYVHEHYGCTCFADDTGLEIEALHGQPGVYSARYAGEPQNPAKNREKVLRLMQGMKQRTACFRTVIAFIHDGKTHYFEGRIDGEITTEEFGKQGFGYDPIFQPNGYEQTFAQLQPEVKNTISHRALAMQQFITFLREFL